MKKLIFTLAFLFVITINKAQNCGQISYGTPAYIPINDLGTNSWNSFQGGLYPNGSNAIPTAHLTPGLQLASQIQPLDANGNADINGKIVFLSVGMSNTTMEFSTFIPMGNSDINRKSNVVLVDGAQSGQTAQIISNPADTFWTNIDIRLQNNSVTAKQVQVIWYKEADFAGSVPVPQTYSDSLRARSKRIMNIIKTRYPNAKICYIASRIYGGYASTALNPEPYAYWQGWAMKWLIEDQINGDPMLQYSGSGANSPWLCWGTYNWANGLTPRSDGLTWVCPTDFNSDGTHPSVTGRQKVASKLLAFVDTDTTACWYRTTGCSMLTTVNFNSVSSKDVQIFPNPVSSDSFLKINKTILAREKKVELLIYDALGKKIKSVPEISSSPVLLEMKDFAPGMYFFTLVSGGKELAKGKFIIQ